MFFFFWLDFALATGILFLSFYYWLTIRGSVKFAKCHYFEKIKRPCKDAIETTKDKNQSV